MDTVTGMIYRRLIYDGAKVIGFYDTQPAAAGFFLHWVYVDPEYRGQEVRRSLVVALLAEARAARQRVFIDFVPGLKASSVAFYLEMGFVEMYRYGPEGENQRLVTPDFDAVGAR